MIIHRILAPERTYCDVHGVSKKKILEFIAEHISNDVPEINNKDLFEALVARERLGTTGLGNGIAIPHCRCKACPKPVGMFMRLAEPVDFDAVDQKPVDLVFALIVPEGENQEYLDILKALAETFHSETTINEIHQLESAESLYDYMIQR